jgi:formylglycine-generating enzyme
MKMATIPEGWFWIGSEDGYRWERPRHRVWLASFQIATTPVTRREYSAFLIATGHSEPAGWHDPAFADPDQPVAGVNWFDAVAYCRWFSASSQSAFRLPTEAEWEKSCRGGIEDTQYAWGNAPPSTIEYFSSAWNAPRPVGQWLSNGYGLFNMGENVHEWCADWYSETYYESSPEMNPTGPEHGTRRVSRGGSWRHQVKASRNSHRSSLPPEYRYTDYGFRVAL